MEYLSWFDFDIQYVKGISNKVADSLSCYYQSDTWEDEHPPYDFVTWMYNSTPREKISLE